MATKKRLVLIGNGMAGIYCLEEILKLSPDKYHITVFGAENYPNYNRILLSSILSGEMSHEDIILNNLGWYQRNQITLHLGEEVTEINRARKIVKTSKLEVPYDRLIIATGSQAVILPLPGKDKKDVMTFRNIDDCQNILQASKKYKKAIVIGGGLLGLEAAYALTQLGMEVHVVHLMNRLMERQLDPRASTFLKTSIEKRGIHIHLEKESSEIFGEDRVEGIRFKDGSQIKADCVIMAVGTRPNIQLAKSCGLYCERGIVVNDTMQTYDPAIYAVGECVEHRGKTYGLVAPLFEQGKVVANQLVEDGSQDYCGSILSTRLKVIGVEVFSCGEFLEKDEHETIQYIDKGQGIYKKLVLENNKIVGAVLFGDTSEGPSFLQMMIDEKDISSYRSSHSILRNLDASQSGLGQIEFMSDDTVICGCNGITKGMIAQAIRTEGLFTREEVKDCTKASGSCGGCAPLVDQILLSIHGSDVEATRHKQTLCKCTSLSRNEIIHEIKSKQFTQVKEVMHVLDWETEGCTFCRPALNYFLKMVYPDQAVEDASSRVANERYHANIQKDATYSVVPRIYGGVTSPTELRNIANLSEKYQVKMLKLTGGQRIDMLGVKKEDLPHIWADLNMPSGSAYGKSVRTVKSCVGSSFCRFGIQDSISMAIAIEKKFENINMPAKIKMAVSGCPRNCAESSIKDLGIIGIEGGWEIYVGGNGGVQTHSANLLCRVKTSEEVFEITAAYLQYYRENANYLERTSQWIERVGLGSIIENIIKDMDKRQALVNRILIACKELIDPWKKIIKEQNKLKEENLNQFASLS